MADVPIKSLLIYLLTLFNLCFCSAQVKVLHATTVEDSLVLVEAYKGAKNAVFQMKLAMDSIWNADNREEAWNQHSNFVKWLGSPNHMAEARRKINRINSQFQRRMYLVVRKKNKGRCKGWISAWTLPYGCVKIRFCDDYFKYRVHLQEKTLVHEIGHEVGMLFHRRVYGCWAAERAARDHDKVAKRNPENYAWLAVSFLGLSCKTRGSF